MTGSCWTFALTFTPDGKHVLAGGADARITVLDVATAKPLHQVPPEAGSYVVEINFLGDRQHTATFYFDNAGERAPHALLWDTATAKSAALKSDAPLGCGTVVGGSCGPAARRQDSYPVAIRIGLNCKQIDATPPDCPERTVSAANDTAGTCSDCCSVYRPYPAGIPAF